MREVGATREILLVEEGVSYGSAQRYLEGRLIWRVNYSPKDYVGRRGGDLIVEVDASDGTIK